MKQKIKISQKTWLITGLILAIIVSLLISWAVHTSRSKPPERLRDIASVSANIHYCNSNDSAQTLDLYQPKNTGTDDTPLVVYIHGGGWRYGDKRNPMLSTYGPSFIKNGVAVAAVNYRLNTKNPYPDQNNDIACALAYIDTNAIRLHINTKKIVYFGESAGGQLAAFAALNIPYEQYDYEAPVGVIDFYGVSDFSKIINGTKPDLNARRYLGSKYNKVASVASPSSYVTKEAPRFLFFHGTRDKIVPISQSKDFYNQLTKVGIDAEYVTIAEARHGFTGPELMPAQYKTIQDNINTFLKETTMLCAN